MEKEGNITKKRMIGGCLTTIILFCFLVYGIVQCSKPKKINTNTSTNTTNKTSVEKELPPGNYPDFIYYDNATYKISGKFQRDNFVFGVTQVPFYDYFTDEDFLKTAKMVDESDYGYVEIRFSDKKTSLVLQKGIAQISSLYGVTAEQGGINKGLLWFTVENGKVLRLNEEQVKKYDSQ